MREDCHYIAGLAERTPIRLRKRSASAFIPSSQQPREVLAHTGTHDNDTPLGWWNRTPGTDSTRTSAEIAAERDFAGQYLCAEGRDMNWIFIRTVMVSAADTVLIALQDMLGLSSEARMNLPRRPDGNWQWRMPPGSPSPEHERRLRHLARIYDRWKAPPCRNRD